MNHYRGLQVYFPAPECKVPSENECRQHLQYFHPYLFQGDLFRRRMLGAATEWSVGAPPGVDVSLCAYRAAAFLRPAIGGTKYARWTRSVPIERILHDGVLVPCDSLLFAAHWIASDLVGGVVVVLGIRPH